MRPTIHIMYLLATFFFIVSCTKDKAPIIIDDGGIGDFCNGKMPVYDNEIKLIINSNCNIAGCHDGVNTRRQPMTNYMELKRLVDLGWIETRVIVDASMPPSGTLPEAERQLIACWLQNGAPEK